MASLLGSTHDALPLNPSGSIAHMLLPPHLTRLLSGAIMARSVTNETASSPTDGRIRPLAQADGIDKDGFNVRNFTWTDAEGSSRTAALVRNNAVDPSGFKGGYMRALSYEVDGALRTCSSNIADQPGFGYTVNHYVFNNTYPAISSRSFLGIGDTTVFSGAHHALHQFRYNYVIGDQPLATTIEWLFTSGRSNPVWAVTFDTSQAAPNSILADTRAPYGEFDYDGGTDSAVAGIGWGDRYKFRTQGSVVGVNSSWTYNEPYLVPYVNAYTSSPDAEMGLVQTQTSLQHDAGGYDGYKYWNKTAPRGPMPKDSDWPYQLIQYELPYSNASKRMAWGANYGAVGQNPYLAMDHQTNLSGQPYQSYAVHIVLGRHALFPTMQQMTEVETLQGAKLTAGDGVVVTTHLPAGVGRSDLKLTEPLGYDPRYATWNLAANASAPVLSWSLSVAQGALHRPSFVVQNWTSSAGPASVSLSGATLPADSLQGYMASVDTVGKRLWLTLGPSARADETAQLSLVVPRNQSQHSHAGLHPAPSRVGLLMVGLLAHALAF